DAHEPVGVELPQVGDDRVERRARHAGARGIAHADEARAETLADTLREVTALARAQHHDARHAVTLRLLADPLDRAAAEQDAHAIGFIDEGVEHGLAPHAGATIDRMWRGRATSGWPNRCTSHYEGHPAVAQRAAVPNPMGDA